VVGDEEGRPAQAHGKQSQSDDEVTLHLGPNVFLVGFHDEMVLCGKCREILEKNKKTTLDSLASFL
jgi:hypothetical protein